MKMINNNFMKARAYAELAKNVLGEAGGILMSHADDGQSGEDAYHAVYGVSDAVDGIVGLMDAATDLDTLMHKARTVQAMARATAAALPEMTAHLTGEHARAVARAISFVGIAGTALQCVLDKLLAGQQADEAVVA